LKARLLDDDDFGLANELCLCKGARVLLTRNLWVEAGLINGAHGGCEGICLAHGWRPELDDEREARADLCDRGVR
jgi:hypothetical protein